MKKMRMHRQSKRRRSLSVLATLALLLFAAPASAGTPIVNNTLDLSVTKGGYTSLEIKPTIDNVDASSGSALSIVCSIGGSEQSFTYTPETASSTLSFTFSSDDLNGLAAKTYPILLSSQGNGSNAGFSEPCGLLTIKNAQPKLTGSNAMAVSRGAAEPLAVTATLANAFFGESIAFTCDIGGARAITAATANGQIAFTDFPAGSLNALAAGSYPIAVSSAANSGNYASSANIGTLTVSEAARVPATITPATATVAYTPLGIDLSSLSLFDFGGTAGERTYSLAAGGSGTGSIPNGHMLSVTKAGTFFVGVTTAQTDAHEAGESITPATLTVGKGEQTAPDAALGATSPTYYGGGDGAITGLEPLTDYEYVKSETGPDEHCVYTPTSSDASGEITGLWAGTYYVRYPGNDVYEPSPVSAAVSVHDPTPTVEVAEEQDGKLTAGEAGSASFMVSTAFIQPGTGIALHNAAGVPGISLETAATAGAATPITVSIDETTPAGGHELSIIVEGVSAKGVPLTSNTFHLLVGAIPVVIAPETDPVRTYNGAQIDLSELFNIDPNAGAATYTVASGDGNNDETNHLLTVTAAGHFTIELYTAPQGNYAAGLASTTLTVNKGEQNPPETLFVTDPSYRGGQDGKINGLIDGIAYEYRQEEAAAYTQITAATAIERLSAGTYLIRFAQTAVYNASEPARLSITDPAAIISIGSQPGQLFSGTAGAIGELTVGASVSGADYAAGPLTFSCSIGGKTKTAIAQADGELSFTFNDGDLDALAAAVTAYDITVGFEGDSHNQFASANVGAMKVKALPQVIAAGDSVPVKAGRFTSLSVRAEASYIGVAPTFTARIGAATAQAAPGNDGALLFAFDVSDLNALAVGNYPVTVSSTANADNAAMVGTDIAALTVVAATPSVSGANALRGDWGAVGNRTISATLTEAFFGDDIAFACDIGGATAVASARANGTLAFEFSAAQLNGLALGDYDIEVHSDGNGDNAAVARTKVGELRLDVPTPAVPDVAPDGSGAGGSEIELSGAQGTLGAQTISTSLAGAVFGDPITFTCDIGGVQATDTVSANGPLSFEFAAARLDVLAADEYDIMLTSPANSWNEAVEKRIGTLSVTEKSAPVSEPAAPANWSVPATFKATKGFTYSLVDITGDPKLSYAFSNKQKRVAINSAGQMTTKKTGKVTVTVSDGARTQKCRITVVANSFSRSKPLMIKGEPAVFTSTKKLSYKNKKLYAEVYVYNRTGNSLRLASDLTLRLTEGGEPIFTRAISWKPKKALKNKRYSVYRLTITDAMLPGVSGKAFDLGGKRIQAMISGTDANGNRWIPLSASTPGVSRPKTAEPGGDSATDEPDAHPTDDLGADQPESDPNDDPDGEPIYEPSFDQPAQDPDAAAEPESP